MLAHERSTNALDGKAENKIRRQQDEPDAFKWSSLHLVINLQNSLETSINVSGVPINVSTCSGCVFSTVLQFHREWSRRAPKPIHDIGVQILADVHVTLQRNGNIWRRQ